LIYSFNKKWSFLKDHVLAMLHLDFFSREEKVSADDEVASRVPYSQTEFHKS